MKHFAQFNGNSDFSEIPIKFAHKNEFKLNYVVELDSFNPNIE